MKNVTLLKTTLLAAVAVLGVAAINSASAAVSLDRTRVIFNGQDSSMSLKISNDNKQLPYLAQSWIEDANGKKISSPFTVLPPVQRLEPSAKSQLKIQTTAGVSSLPKDRESLFYFNLREIPPRSTKANTLQIALQTKIKMFFRPEAIALDKTQAARGDWIEKVTLKRTGNKYVVNNPTPYYLTIVSGAASKTSEPVKLQPLMVAPKSSSELDSLASDLGNNPVLNYINDYGGKPKIQFSCSGDTCQAKLIKEKK